MTDLNDIKKLGNRISELEDEVSVYKAESSTELILRRNAEMVLSAARIAVNDLQIEKNNLESKNSDLHREIQDIIKAGKEQLVTKDKQINQLNNQLTITKTEKNEEINRLKNEIGNLKGELGQSKKEFLRQKIRSKEGKLETFIQKLGVNRCKIMDDLLNAYKRLLRAEKNFNQDNIDASENDINGIKQQLLTNGIIYRGISVDNAQKFCSKCEKLAKLKLELNQIQQEQYQAQQEQPTNN